MLALHIKLKQVLRPTGVMKISSYLRNSKVKYKFFFRRRSGSSDLSLEEEATIET